jgi:hypothetical protein
MQRKQFKKRGGMLYNRFWIPHVQLQGGYSLNLNPEANIYIKRNIGSSLMWIDNSAKSMRVVINGINVYSDLSLHIDLTLLDRFNFNYNMESKKFFNNKYIYINNFITMYNPKVEEMNDLLRYKLFLPYQDVLFLTEFHTFNFDFYHKSFKKSFEIQHQNFTIRQERYWDLETFSTNSCLYNIEIDGSEFYNSDDYLKSFCADGLSPHTFANMSLKLNRGHGEDPIRISLKSQATRILNSKNPSIDFNLH